MEDVTAGWAVMRPADSRRSPRRTCSRGKGCAKGSITVDDVAFDVGFVN